MGFSRVAGVETSERTGRTVVIADIGGIRIQISAQDDAFLAYCSEYLGSARAEEDDRNRSMLRAHIATEHARAPQSPSGLIQIGSTVSHDSREIWFDLGQSAGVGINAVIEPDGIWSVSCFPRIDILHQVWHWLRLRRYRRVQLYMMLIRHGVLLPALAEILRRRYWTVFHASAVQFNGEAMLLVGLNGSGKTSLAWHLVETLGSELLSDNYVLVDPEEMMAYRVPEPIRLPPGKSLGHGYRSIGSAFGKVHWVLPSDRISPGLPIGSILHVCRGGASKVRLAESAEMYGIFESMHGYLSETPGYSWPQLAHRILNGTDLLSVERKGRLRACNSAQCGIVEIMETVDEQGRYKGIPQALESLG